MAPTSTWPSTVAICTCGPSSFRACTCPRPVRTSTCAASSPSVTFPPPLRTCARMPRACPTWTSPPQLSTCRSASTTASTCTSPPQVATSTPQKREGTWKVAEPSRTVAVVVSPRRVVRCTRLSSTSKRTSSCSAPFFTTTCDVGDVARTASLPPATMRHVATVGRIGANVGRRGRTGHGRGHRNHCLDGPVPPASSRSMETQPFARTVDGHRPGRR
mmetsp:Transcript_8525/g.53279  ORF Transcript_8525/g.53279 Transcript_8525/m.53279 type:complete len:217 (+) Transcript_8525:2184-2834(+)